MRRWSGRRGAPGRARAFAVVVLVAAVARAQAPPLGEEPAGEPVGDAAPEETGAGGDTETPEEKKFTVGVALSGGGQLGAGVALTDDGRTRLHFTLDSGAGYDSNPYAVPFEDQAFKSDLVLRVRPGITLESKGANVDVVGAAKVDYGFFPGIFDRPGERGTQNWLLYQTSAAGDVQWNRHGMFTLAFGDTVSFNSDPGQLVVGTTLTRLHNSARVGVGYRPGRGTLMTKVSYTFDFVKWFDTDDAPGFAIVGLDDQMIHTFSLRTDWRFLPRTAVFGEVRGGIASFPFAADDQPISFPVGATVGVAGTFTSKIAGTASIGYANPLTFDDQPTGTYTLQSADYFGLMGQVEARWRLAAHSLLGAGFQRTVNPAPLYQHVTNNRFYAAFAQTIAERGSLNLNMGYSVLQFGYEQPVNGQPVTDVPNGDRLDGHLDLRLAIAYAIVEWFRVGVSNNTDWRLTNADVGAGVNSLNLSFLRNQTLFTLAVAY